MGEGHWTVEVTLKRNAFRIWPTSWYLIRASIDGRGIMSRFWILSNGRRTYKIKRRGLRIAVKPFYAP